MNGQHIATRNIVKHVLLIVVMFVCSVPFHPSWCQVNAAKKEASQETPATKVEAFVSKKGSLIVKEFFKTGTIDGKYNSKVRVSALIAYDPSKPAEKIRGLRIEVQEGGRIESSHTSFLDLDEAESLSAALQYIQSLIAKNQNIEQEYTETIFSTKGDFDLGFYQQRTDFTAFAHSGRIARTTSFLDIGALKDIKIAVENAILMAKK